MKNTNTKTQKRSLRSTGSFFNYLMANNSIIPVVGKGATILLYSDRKVAEVIEVSKDGIYRLTYLINKEIFYKILWIE